MGLLRFVARLRRHDWTAAAIELAIVVLGILIALQVSNWNQDRLDRARGEAYARRIHAELVADRSGSEGALAFWNAVSAYGRQAMAYAEDGTLAEGSRWRTVLAFYQASQIRTFKLEDTTFAEMRAAGDLSLIADESLRTRLAQYYRLTSTDESTQVLRHDPEYRRRVRGLTPWAVQEYIWEHCWRQTDLSQELIDCPAPIGEEASAALLADYTASPELLRELRYWMATLRVSGVIVGVARERAGELMEEVEAVAE
jgi:hypothetical protein